MSIAHLQAGHLKPPNHAHGGYNVMITGNKIAVSHDDGTPVRGDSKIVVFDVSRENTGTDLSKWLNYQPPRVMALGWGIFPDGMEVIYYYDKSDANMGYACNLDCDWCSEWGYAPFEVDPAVTQHHRKEDYE